MYANAVDQPRSTVHIISYETIQWILQSQRNSSDLSFQRWDLVTLCDFTTANDYWLTLNVIRKRESSQRKHWSWLSLPSHVRFLLLIIKSQCKYGPQSAEVVILKVLAYMPGLENTKFEKAKQSKHHWQLIAILSSYKTWKITLYYFWVSKAKTATVRHNTFLDYNLY